MNHISLENDKRINCNIANNAPFVVPGFINEFFLNCAHIYLSKDTPKIQYPDEVQVRRKCFGKESLRESTEAENQNGESEVHRSTHELPEWQQEFRETSADEKVVPRSELFGDLITTDHKMNIMAKILKKNGEKKRSGYLEKLQNIWVPYFRKWRRRSIHRFCGKNSNVLKSIRHVKLTKSMKRHAHIRDQNPSLGYICSNKPV